MLSLQSSSSLSANDKINVPDYPWWMQLLTWICRIFVGGVFLFSGFAKGIDPWGTIYKFKDYLGVFGWDLPMGILVTGVFLLCGYEFLTGLFLVFGCYRRSAPWMAALLMMVMVPLTLWIAIKDPVADCGCFGDALVISNWATFWKNIVITSCIIWLVLNNLQTHSLISPAFQWLAFVAGAIYITFISWHGYKIQPMIDFRSYKVNDALISNDVDSNDISFIFVYEKDGIRKEFSDTDNLPDEESGWNFIERKDILPDKSAVNSKSSFSVWDKDGKEEVTDEAILTEGPELILLIPSLKEISASSTWRINALYDWAEHNDIPMIGIVAPESGNIEEWEDLSLPKYDLFTADDTAIKELARGNLAVVYLNDGIIIWKSSLWALDSSAYEDPDANTEITAMAPDGDSTLQNVSLSFGIVILFLIIITMIPRLSNLFIVRRKDNNIEK